MICCLVLVSFNCINNIDTVLYLMSDYVVCAPVLPISSPGEQENSVFPREKMQQQHRKESWRSDNSMTSGVYCHVTPRTGIPNEGVFRYCERMTKKKTLSLYIVRWQKASLTGSSLSRTAVGSSEKGGCWVFTAWGHATTHCNCLQ
ncbi:hypothetical protein CEXT_380361 [Caerostris extrusa]|uniref:Uncharacterized protein n=1 Tax=Caerostris extrusa TaxID=172846 RepID=A0AAV4WBM3_CAEEX|nr:hypothetical protein CEXT_380361 [Caerostris extrusa]